MMSAWAASLPIGYGNARRDSTGTRGQNHWLLLRTACQLPWWPHAMGMAGCEGGKAKNKRKQQGLGKPGRWRRGQYIMSIFNSCLTILTLALCNAILIQISWRYIDVNNVRKCTQSMHCGYACTTVLPGAGASTQQVKCHFFKVLPHPIKGMKLVL
jgi:hypothetical protein